AQRLAARLQDIEKPAAADTDEAMARGAHAPALDADLDIVPMIEGILDRVRRLQIAAPHVLHGGIGEDDAPAEGVVGAVASDDPDLVARIELLHQQGEIEAGGPAANACDSHGISSGPAGRTATSPGRYFIFKAITPGRQSGRLLPGCGSRRM